MSDEAKRYSRLFRKAGLLLAKGMVSRAVEVFEEGRRVAEQYGDQAMAALFAREIEEARRRGRPGDRPSRS